MIEAGQRIPDTKIFILIDNSPVAVSSSEYFAGKQVAVFGVPGAFTRTCSARHLPGFVNTAGDFKAAGIDEIACISSNDVFVLNAWADAYSASDSVTMVSDGLLNFCSACGLSVELVDNGFGRRCRRFSMIVKDGVITHFHIEKPGEFGQTSAETLLADLTVD